MSVPEPGPATACDDRLLLGQCRQYPDQVGDAHFLHDRGEWHRIRHWECFDDAAWCPGHCRRTQRLRNGIQRGRCGGAQRHFSSGAIYDRGASTSALANAHPFTVTVAITVAVAVAITFAVATTVWFDIPNTVNCSSANTLNRTAAALDRHPSFSVDRSVAVAYAKLQ